MVGGGGQSADMRLPCLLNADLAVLHSDNNLMAGARVVTCGMGICGERDEKIL